MAKYVKQRCFEIECDRCGKKFMQKRATQRFCGVECRHAYDSANVSENRKLKQKLIEAYQEIKELKNRIADMEGN